MGGRECAYLEASVEHKPYVVDLGISLSYIRDTESPDRDWLRDGMLSEERRDEVERGVTEVVYAKNRRHE